MINTNPNIIEDVIWRFRTTPIGVPIEEVIDNLRNEGVPEDIIFLAYHAYLILDKDQSP